MTEMLFVALIHYCRMTIDITIGYRFRRYCFGL